MSAYPQHVWAQLRNITKGKLISALERDGWQLDVSVPGSARTYRRAATERIAIDFHHSSDTFRNPGLLKGLLDDIGWTIDDLRRLKLIR